MRDVICYCLSGSGKYYRIIIPIATRIMKSRCELAYEHLIFCPEEQTTEEMVFSGVEDTIDVT